MIMRSIHQEEIISNFCATKSRSSKYMKQKLKELQGEIDKSTIILRDFNSSFTVIDKTSRWKINRHREALQHTSDTCRITHLTAAECKLVQYTPLIYTSLHYPKILIGRWELRKESKSFYPLLISLTLNIPYWKKLV